MPRLKPQETCHGYRIIRLLDPKDEPSSWTYSYLAENHTGIKAIITFLDRERILERFSSTEGPEAYKRKVEQFKKEAEFLRGVSHPHIVMTYDSGYDDRNEEPFIVKEYFTGVSFYDAVKSGLNPVGISWYLGGLLEALYYLHTEKGVLHLNIKSKRIRLAAEKGEKAKFTDCGYAIPIKEANEKGVLIGTPNTMPTEVILGRKGSIGPLSDLQSMGMHLYYCVTGHFPFPGRSAAGGDLKKLATIVKDEDLPLPPLSLNPACPKDFSDIIMHLLQKDPADRVYKNALEVKHAFAEVSVDELTEDSFIDDEPSIF